MHLQAIHQYNFQLQRNPLVAVQISLPKSHFQRSNNKHFQLWKLEQRPSRNLGNRGEIMREWYTFLVIVEFNILQLSWSLGLFTAPILDQSREVATVQLPNLESYPVLAYLKMVLANLGVVEIGRRPLL